MSRARSELDSVGASTVALCQKGMAVLTINTRKGFEDWLIENAHFSDARVLSLSPTPEHNSSSVPSEVTVELACQIEGSYKAHSTRVSRVLRIQATNIAEYHLAGDGTVSSEHWSEGMESIDSDYPIAFEIDVPGPLTLCCSEISVEDLPDLIETVSPWLSDREVFAKVPAASLPTPAEWQTKFNELDQDVVWHIYRGAPQKTADVPSSNYEGWFLQAREDLIENQQGIFFFACKPDEDGFRVQIQNQGVSSSLWQAAMSILAAFHGGEIHCGNCEFSGGVFLAELENWNKAQQGGERPRGTSA